MDNMTLFLNYGMKSGSGDDGEYEALYRAERQRANEATLRATEAENALGEETARANAAETLAAQETIRANEAEEEAESEKLRADTAEANVATQTTRAEEAEQRATTAENALASETERANTAEALATSETQRANDATTRAETAEAEVERLEEELANAGDTSIPIDNATSLFTEAARLHLAERMTFEGCTNFSKAFATIGTTMDTNFITSLPLIDTSDGTKFNEMYKNCTSVRTFPTIDTSNGTDFNSMYWGCTKMQEFPQLDVSKGTDFASMIRQCNALTTVPALNTVNGTNFDAMFYQSKAIVTITKINVSNATKLSSAFYQNTALVTIGFEGTIPISIDFSTCPNLSLESAKGVLIALENYSGTDKEFANKVSFNATVWELLDADGETSPTGTTWKDFIYSKGWIY